MKKDDTEFLTKRSTMVGKARDLGVQPMPLAKLAGYLGYDPRMVLPGRVEALDINASRRLQNPQGRVVPAAPAAEKPKDEAEPKPEEGAAADPK